jgi:phage terminase large subunit-like protein
MEPRIGAQTPTHSVVQKYGKTQGKEAIRLYEKTGRKAREWQQLLIYDILGQTEEGLWAHTRYGYEVPRRNGKGEILTIRELYGLSTGEVIMHTAHRTPTSHNAWERLYRLVKQAGLEIESEYRAAGKEHIYIKDGGRIEFRTRTSKGGLGEGFDLLIIDEAQEYQDDHESALKYVVTDSANPQTILCGTPPTAVSSGTVFVKFREKTRWGENPNAGWAEWSVDEMTDPQDKDAWYKCNPSLGLQLTERAIADETGGDITDFNIQRLGLWLSYNQKSAISRVEWQKLMIEEELSLTSKLYVGVKYGVDGQRMAVSVAVKTAAGKIFVECLFCQEMKKGNARLLDFLEKADVAKVVADGKAGQDLLDQEMKERKLGKPIKPTVSQIIVSNALFEQAIEKETLAHNGQPSLEEVVSNCEKRPIASTGFGYRTIKPDMEVSIMDSVILAHWAAAEDKGKSKQKIRY